MLKKLLKYDFKSYFVKMVPAVIIYASVCIITAILSSLNKAYPTNKLIIAFSSLGTSILSLVTSVFSFYGLILVVLRYGKNCFKDEGYLTHTLPVSKHTLLLSKYILFTVNYVFCAIITCIGYSISYSSKYSEIGNVLDYIINNEEIEGIAAQLLRPDIIFFTLLTIIVGMLLGITIYLLAIALGHSMNKNKTLMSVVFYFVITYALGFLGAGFLTYEFLMLTFSNITSYIVIFYIIDMPFLIVSTVLLIVGYILTYKAMNSKLNLQ